MCSTSRVSVLPTLHVLNSIKGGLCVVDYVRRVVASINSWFQVNGQGQAWSKLEPLIYMNLVCPTGANPINSFNATSYYGTFANAIDLMNVERLGRE